MKTSGTGDSGSLARYIMIGGFLGAGKTTAVSQLAKRLVDQGKRVGLITNDQGNGLVDTALLRARGFATEEIAGGCFCCRFNSLTEAAARLTQAGKPEVFIAEPVGSCTDLVATVSYPLRRIYGDRFVIAPLSVLVDPWRAMRLFGLEEGRQFSSKVQYIYRKQLEEADYIVINKVDRLSSGQHETLHSKLAAEFPAAQILKVSARTGEGMEEWFAQMLAGNISGREAMAMDYTLYAEGEALLGWLNATLRVAHEAGFLPDELLETLCREVQDRLNGQGIEIAHLKMTFSPSEGLEDLAVVNVVRNDWVAELSQSIAQPVRAGQLIVNLRAEGDPLHLEEVLQECVAQVQKTPAWKEKGVGRLELEHLERFRPGEPRPTHRMISASEEGKRG